MDTKLTLRPDYSPHRTSAGVLLIGEKDRILVTGPAEGALLEMLAEGMPLEQALGRLISSFPRETLEGAIEAMKSRGILTPVSEPMPGEEAAYWEASGIQATGVARRLRETSVAIHALTPFGGKEVAAALEAMGMTIGENGDFTVVVVADYLQSDLRDLARRLGNRPWMPIKPVGIEIWFGPAFIPSNNACFECLRLGLIENRWSDIPLWAQGAALPAPSKGALPVTVAIAAALGVKEIARLTASPDQATTGGLYSFDTDKLSLTRHPVLPRGGCGCATLPDPTQLEGAQQFVSPICGLFHDQRDLTPDPECPVRIHTVRYTLPYQISEPSVAMQPPVAVGRGFSDRRAEYSSLAEAVERRSLFYRADEPRVRARLRPGSVHPEKILLFSERQYAQRNRLNRDLPPYFQIPDVFDENREIDWSPARSLVSGNEVHVPSFLCYLRHPNCGFEGVDSNGCAAGPDKGTAILNGFYELVEREAAAIWWYSRARRPALRLDDPDIARTSRYLRSRGIEFYLLDLTTDWQIPVTAAVGHAVDGSQIMVAFGSHMDGEHAARQATTELVQSMVARERYPGHPGRGLAPSAKIADHPYLRPCGAIEFVRVTVPLPKLQLEIVTARARALGLDLLALDLTRQDTRLPVVRVIVPGMRPRTPRFALGRLYEVPVRLKWIRRPLEEEELNPIFLF